MRSSPCSGNRTIPCGREIEGYRRYPDSWPRLGAPALLHFGDTPGLVGQLEFDFPVGRITTVAVPLAGQLPEQVLARPRSLFAFVVHEAFHQFQRSAFREVNEPSEEQYPILEIANDFFGAEWKSKAANLPDSSALADLLALSVPVSASRLEALRKEAERRYDLPQLERRTRTLADAYVREADDAIRAFDAQPGYRVEVRLPAAGTSRSRSSTGKRWVVNNGRRVFGNEFLAYTLRRPDQQVLLTVERRAVLDDLVPPGERYVAFFVPSLDSIRVNGVPLAVASVGNYRFDGLSMQGTGFSLDVKVPGTVSLSAGHIAVFLTSKRFPVY